MTAIEKSYRLRIATAGATSVPGNVDFTYTVEIASIGEIGGQRVDPITSRTSARPWTVPVIDASDAVVSQLSDADGRAQLMMRLADLSVSTDGGSTWTVLATARVADIRLTGVNSFEFEFQDERVVERNTTIFKAGNTTRLFPPGLDAAWLDFQPALTVEYVAAVNVAGTTDYSTTGFIDASKALPGFSRGLSGQAMDLMEDDIVEDPAANQGNFRTLRANVAGTDREIMFFNGVVFGTPTHPVRGLRKFPTHYPVSFRVAGFEDTPGAKRQVYFHLKGRDPSSELPLHIGGQAGIDRAQLVKDLFDGSHQDAANPQTVRYDATVFSTYDASTNPTGLIGHPAIPKGHWRIKRPWNMARFIEDEICEPHGLAPFVNEDGEVSLRFTRQPATDLVSDPDTLFEFNASNCREPFPTWDNRGRDQVTVLELTFEYVSAPSFTSEPAGGLFGEIFGGTLKRPTPSDAKTALDLLTDREITITREHDRASTIRRVHEMTVRGMHRLFERGAFVEAVSQSLFERHGDGPVLTTVHGLSATEGVRQGDYVAIDLDSYPNLKTGGRGGKRILLVLDRVDTPVGPTFELLDAGPADQPLTAPTVAVAANSNDAHNAVDVTISGLGAGESYEVHIAVNATEPGESSALWQYRTITGTTNETRTVRGVPSGSTIWARPRATAPGRISSDWGTADSQATTALSPPTGVADSDLAGDVATVSWTNGESDFDLLVDLDGDPVARLDAGAVEYQFLGLEPSTAYTAGVRHIDDYGGESSRATDGFTTTGTPTVLPAPRALEILVGLRV